MIPLFHDFSDATVLVFGGGPVGARRARRFAREARVLVVSPTFGATAFGSASLIRAAPDAGDVGDWLDRTDAALVVAATDDESVNDAIEAAARERGVLVNRADRRGGREPGSVVVPATVRDDPVVVAIGTDGLSPALSAHLRERLEGDLRGAGAVATVTAAVRDELRDRGWSPERRREAVRTLVAADPLWKALGSGDPNVENVIAEVLDEVGQSDAGERP